MKKLTLLSLLTVILFAACAFTDEPASILGRWENITQYQGAPLSFMVVFRSSGNYDGFVNKKTFVSGKYKMQHDTLYISDPICNSSYQGTYKVQFFGQDSIKFHLIRDTCQGRREGVNNVTYKKVRFTAK